VLTFCGLVAILVLPLVCVWFWCRRPSPKTRLHESLDDSNIHDSGLHYHVASHLKRKDDAK
jgi:hypothetical protein